MEAKPISTQPANPLPPSQKEIETHLTSDAIFSIIASLTILSAVIAPIVYACIPKRMLPSFSFKSPHKAPCHRCRYFSGNPHLKCALHPMTVLTEQAVDCADYCPNMR
jgi:hypothetical protein